MNEHAIVTLAGIGLIAIACQWLAWLVKVPSILLLLLAGMLAGPVTGWLDPDALFGTLLFPLIALSVAVILFEGSLTLKLEEIRGLERVVRNLVSVGVLVTWVVTAALAHLLLGFEWELAILFGAVTVVTGPTVIVPLLRTVRPNATVANLLRWEGIVIDPIGALLAVLVFQFILSGRGSDAMAQTLVSFGQVLAVGLGLGAAAGFGLGQVLRKYWLPEYLHSVAALTVMFGVFALSNAVHAESGLLTVTVMGIWLANMPGVRTEGILDFKESLSILLISAMFIILAARIEFRQFVALGWAGVGVFLGIQFIARPLKVFVSTLGSTLSWQERALMGWIAPRGIVAAAVAAVFSLRLRDSGSPEMQAQADLLVPLTFLVIIGTVGLQSATARMLARWLGVAEPEPRGLLLVGANIVARAIGKALSAEGFRVLLTDTTWDNVSTARMDGLSAYFGNPVSEHADRRLDLVGIGRLLALSPHKELNALATLRYRTELGANAVYTLQTAAEKTLPSQLKIAAKHHGQILFGEEVTYAKLARLLSNGAEIRATTLSESFDMTAYQEQYGSQAIPLFAVTPRGRLRMFLVEDTPKVGEGWTIIGLIPPSNQEGHDARQKVSD